MTRPTWRPGTADQGFTLAELLVAMVVLGLLAAIAVPAALTQRRKAYETSAKADVQAITREVSALFVDGTGALVISSSGAVWSITRDGTPVAKGDLSPHNSVSPASRITADGDFCLSVKNSKIDAQFWTADDVGLRSGDCPPP